MNGICAIQTSDLKGEIRFHQCCSNSPTKVSINITGFKPNQTHAIHIHEYGNITSCMKAGGHFNPKNKKHGFYLWDGKNRHAGDLINNITSDRYGNVKIDFEDNLLSLFPNDFCIIGRSVVIHEKKDDLGRGGNPESLITGNAGGRMVCAVIGIDKPEHF